MDKFGTFRKGTKSLDCFVYLAELHSVVFEVIRGKNVYLSSTPKATATTNHINI